MSQLQENQLFANRYRLLKRLGSGAFSEVWKAEDVEAGNLVVAIKIYAPDKGMDEDGVKIFSQEFAIVFNVSHQNLLRPNYFDKNNGSPFLVLPFCENGCALKLIGNNPTEEEVVRFLHDVSAGLAYLHKQNPPIIHQDIKPDNILIDSNGDYKLTDFGISTRIRSTLRRSVGNAHSAGTMAYMAPERFGEHNQPVKASDIWSLGATVYEIMCEDAPFGNLGGGMQKGGAEIPYISGNYSSELKQVVKSCLSKDTWNRPTAEQLRKITEQYLESGKWNLDAITEKAENSPSTPSSGRPTERKTQPFTSAPEKPSGTPEPFSPDLPQPPKKKSLVWLWILLGIVLVGGGIGVGIGINMNKPEDNIIDLSVVTEPETKNVHEYVDLGLPSGLKWATCNIGASTPSDYGNYYAWGEISTKTKYRESNCKTYGMSMGNIAGNAQYDAARANWGGKWRLPTQAEFNELIDKCTWTWTTQGGHKGYKVTGPNGNAIFLPAAGYRYGSSLYYTGEDGDYWSASPYESNTQYACSLYFCSSYHGTYWYYRNYGQSVRPVAE